MSRSQWIRLLRDAHSWIGLWGAALGLLFGLSGIWLNHRSSLKIPGGASTTTVTQLALPNPTPNTPEQMQAWLTQVLHLNASTIKLRKEAAKLVPWKLGDQDPNGAASLTQPEHWTFNCGDPSNLIQIEYWLGNHSVSVRTSSNGFIGTIKNLHVGAGTGIAWILLVDALAGSIMLLSLSGVALWLLTHKRRGLGYVLFCISVSLILALPYFGW